LQYAASEGYAPLRELVATQLRQYSLAAGQPWEVDASHIMITNGSQQGLDLVSKVLVDAGSRVLVQSPTYLGAVSAFTPMEPQIVAVQSDAQGPDLRDMQQQADQARFFYIQPNFQNPTGHTMPEAQRAALSLQARSLGLPLVEDNPYGDLWFDTPPPASLSARNPQGCIYLGSFSKILAPGLRMGYLVAPASVYPKLLQAKQAADLHSAGFNQRVIYEVMQNGFLDQHVPTIRNLYKAQCTAMLDALDKHFPNAAQDPENNLTWNRPAGGMFIWGRLPAGMDASHLFPRAIQEGVAFVPGTPFFSSNPDPRSIRLSFVSPNTDQIHQGVAALAAAIAAQRLEPMHHLP
jgi:2-aminoadipate transaminase